MATATISAVAVEVTTDLGNAPDVGPSLSSISATVTALEDVVFHRITPYFRRVSRYTQDVKMSFACEHAPSASVVYSENGTPQSEKWSGEVRVDTTRTRRTVESLLHRPIRATAKPSQKVPRTIVCEFDAVAVFDSRTMEWVTLGDTDESTPSCHLTFDLQP